MKEKIGVWIDHRKAWIVVPSGKRRENATTVQVESGIEDHTHIAKGVRTDITPGSMDKPSEDKHQRNIQEQLARYYDRVIDNMCEARSILVFGPGQAKVELKNRIKSQRPTWNTPEIEPADRMTSQEIVERMLQHQPYKTMTAA
jgi:stalled ribosome rescue protein Dom34